MTTEIRQGMPLPESRRRPDWRTGPQIVKSGKLVDIEIVGAKITGAAVTDGLTVAGELRTNTGLYVEDWTAPSLGSSWVDYGSGQQGARYRKMPDGTVHIQGCIKNGTTTAGTVFFTLPAGYRPDAALSFPVVINPNALGIIEVQADGDVAAVVVSATYTWINCSFNT